MQVYFISLYTLSLIHICKSVTRRLGKLIANTYVALMVTYSIPVSGYSAKNHKRKLQSLLDRGLRWACKNQTIRESLRVRSCLLYTSRCV